MMMISMTTFGLFLSLLSASPWKMCESGKIEKGELSLKIMGGRALSLPVDSSSAKITKCEQGWKKSHPQLWVVEVNRGLTGAKMNSAQTWLYVIDLSTSSQPKILLESKVAEKTNSEEWTNPYDLKVDTKSQPIVAWQTTGQTAQILSRPSSK